MPDHNFDVVIDRIIEEEVGNAPDGGYTNDPADGGGRTQWGISERAHPEAWADGKVTEDEAREIYYKRYIAGPGFDRITDPHLMHQLVDWGVTSGPSIPIRALQRLVGSEDDGILGPDTLSKVATKDPRDLNNLLCCERLKMIQRIVRKRPSQRRFLNGWNNRAIEFIV